MSRWSTRWANGTPAGLGLARSTHRYRARRGQRDVALRAKLKEIAAKRLRFDYRRLTALLAREGLVVNHKRVYRLYREEGLAMKIRHRQRRGRITSVQMWFAGGERVGYDPKARSIVATEDEPLRIFIRRE